MRLLSCRTFAFVSLACSSTLAGCIDTDGKEPTGQLRLQLAAPSPSAPGVAYRLRDAVVTVDGPTTHRVFNTEDDPNRTSLSADVIVGDYTALLSGTFRIERVELGGTSITQVPSQLLSANPALFSVFEDQRTVVPLQFRVFNEVLDFSQGYDIVLGIEECLQQEVACGDGVDNDCDGLTDCDDTECAADPVCVPAVCGDGILNPGNGEQCDDGNVIDLDGCSSTCQIEVLEVEPNDDGTPEVSNLFEGNDFASAPADANGALSASTTILASIDPNGDEDVFAIENPTANPITVTLATFDPTVGTGNTCTFDSVLHVRDAAGTILASDDDSGPGLCSLLSVSLAPGQRLYAQALDFFDNGPIPRYALVATFQ